MFDIGNAIKRAKDEYVASRNGSMFESSGTPTASAAASAIAGTSVDASHAIGLRVRELLHPKLESYNDLLDEVWEELGLAFLGFSFLRYPERMYE